MIDSQSKRVRSEGSNKQKTTEEEESFVQPITLLSLPDIQEHKYLL